MVNIGIAPPVTAPLEGRILCNHRTGVKWTLRRRRNKTMGTRMSETMRAVDRVLPLAEVAFAHKLVAVGRTHGKLLLDVAA